MLFISTVFAHSLPTGCSEEPEYYVDKQEQDVLYFIRIEHG